MKKNIKYLILLIIIAVLVFFLIFKFYPFKLNKRYSFDLNDFTQPKMTIVKTDMKKTSIEQKPYKPIECTITNKKYIEEIFDNRYIVIVSPTKGLKRYKFNSKDINLEFIDKIINQIKENN